MATYSVSLTEAASASDSILARMVSDTQFAEWLRGDRRDRVVLIEAKAWSGGTEVTRYMSDRGYTSQPGESPANTAYEDIVLAVPDIRSYMGEAFRGRSLVSYGDIEIDNSNGVRDSWLTDGWDKRDVRVYLGDPSWTRSDFRLVFYGTIEEISARDGRTLVLKLRDRQELFSKPLQVNTVAAGPLTAKKRPVCYGTCYSVPGVLSSASAQTFEFNDRALLAIDYVYEDGYSITGSATRVAGGGSGLGAYATYTGHSTGFTSQIVTADVRGFESTTGAIVRRILIDRAGLTDADIDPAALSAWDAAGGGNPVGFYSAADGETIGSALDTLMAGIGGYYAIGRDGRITGGILKRPEADYSSVLDLVADDIEAGRIDLVRRIVPPKTLRLGYKRYWRTIASANNNVTSAQTVNRLQTEYDVLSQAMYGGSVYNSVDAELQSSCFSDSTGATAELTRRYQLWYDLRFVYRVRTFRAAQQINIGDCVTLTMARYGFDAGPKAVVVGMRESLTSGWVELELFK